MYDQTSKVRQSEKGITASTVPIHFPLRQEPVQKPAMTPVVTPENFAPDVKRRGHFQVLRDSIAFILPYFAIIPKTKSIAEPPLATGKHRIRWTCRCGIELWDDFTQLKESAAIELQRNLQDANRIISHNDQSKGDKGDEAKRESDNMPAKSSEDRKISLSDTDPVHGHSDPREEEGSKVSAAISPVPPAPESESRKQFLLLCCCQIKDTLRLSQLDLSGIKSDFQLFEMLKKVYKSRRAPLANLLAVRKVVSVNFRKVSRIHYNILIFTIYFPIPTHENMTIKHPKVRIPPSRTCRRPLQPRHPSQTHQPKRLSLRPPNTQMRHHIRHPPHTPRPGSLRRPQRPRTPPNPPPRSRRRRQPPAPSNSLAASFPQKSQNQTRHVSTLPIRFGLGNRVRRSLVCGEFAVACCFGFYACGCGVLGVLVEDEGRFAGGVGDGFVFDFGGDGGCCSCYFFVGGEVGYDGIVG